MQDHSRHPPHCRDRAPETDKKHCGREMDYLIWLPLVALRGFARAKESQDRWARQLHAHQVRDSEPPIAEAKATLECVPGVLLAVAREVQNRRVREAFEDVKPVRSVRTFEHNDAVICTIAHRGADLRNAANLVGDVFDGREARGGWLGNEQQADVAKRDWLNVAPRLEKRGQGWGVGWDHVIRAPARWAGGGSGRMEREEGEGPCRTPVDARAASTFRRLYTAPVRCINERYCRG